MLCWISFVFKANNERKLGLLNINQLNNNFLIEMKTDALIIIIHQPLLFWSNKIIFNLYVVKSEKEQKKILNLYFEHSDVLHCSCSSRNIAGALGVLKKLCTYNKIKYCSFRQRHIVLWILWVFIVWCVNGWYQMLDK